MLPRPGDLGLDPGAVVAIPETGLEIYRLIRGDAPTEDDFRPMSRAKAQASGLPEILRVGYSAFLKEDEAKRRRKYPSSKVAKVILPRNPLVHVAKTLTPEHVTVWAPPQICLENADVMD